METTFNFIRENWKVIIKVLQFVLLIVGSIIAYRQLRANTEAQRALRSPQIYVFRPKGADPINGLVIKNAGEVIAMNITIKVSEKRERNNILKKLPKNSTKFIPLLAKEEGEKSIFINSLNPNNFSNINVKVKYYSPYYCKTVLRYKNTFSRGGNYV